MVCVYPYLYLFIPGCLASLLHKRHNLSNAFCEEKDRQLKIPLITNEGLKSEVNAHFGSAPYFLIYDTEKETSETISNSDEHHIHGMCHPMKALDDKDIGAVVCGGMGAGQRAERFGGSI